MTYLQPISNRQSQICDDNNVFKQWMLWASSHLYAIILVKPKLRNGKTKQHNNSQVYTQLLQTHYQSCIQSLCPHLKMVNNELSQFVGYGFDQRVYYIERTLTKWVLSQKREFQLEYVSLVSTIMFGCR